ncbi:MAG: CHASE3 domain-containing protein [Rubrivivax sp.]
MLQRLSSGVERLRHSAVAIPVAVLLAGLMLLVNEMAYRGAGSRLERLVQLGQARLLLLETVQRTAEAESGKRGFLLTQGPEYLQPYNESRQLVLRNLDRLREHYRVLGDDEAAALAEQLQTTFRNKLSEMDEVLRLHAAGKPEAALDMVRSGIGRDLMTQLRTQSAGLLDQQNRRISTELTGIFDTLLLNRVAIGSVTAVALLAIVMFVRLGRQLDRQRLLHQQAVEAENERLEREVGRRTTELTELARHLQTAREDERARLARDLHDELGALLTAAKLDVARIKPRLQSAPELLERLTHLTESLNAGIALKRRIIEDLRPSTLGNLGLGPALEVLCHEFQTRSGLDVQTRLEPVALAPSAELTVFRLVQEALTNVAKYAAARRVVVQLARDGDAAQISVEDDGKGFDVSSMPRGTHGLRGMRFRVEAEHGRFWLRSAPGQGTCVRARLPLRDTVPAP